MSKKNKDGKLHEIDENEKEYEFAQKSAIINYGVAPISTYNLVNCIAIGGIFRLPSGQTGSFLTHESPTDYIEQQRKLQQIKSILDTKSAEYIKLVIFRIDNPATNTYSDGLTTEKIIQIMKEFSKKLFIIEPEEQLYSCDIKSFRCGKATISPEKHSSNMHNFVLTNNSSGEAAAPSYSSGAAAAAAPSGTFKPICLTNAAGNRIIQCPICKSISGTSWEYLSHAYNCTNKNKTIEVHYTAAGSKEPVCLDDKNMNMGAKGGSTEGGRRKKSNKKKTHRKIQRRKMKKTRHIKSKVA